MDRVRYKVLPTAFTGGSMAGESTGHLPYCLRVMYTSHARAIQGVSLVPTGPGR